MKTHWHPISTLLFDAPRCYATPALLELFLPGGPVAMRYAGDRMSPALDHGAPFDVEPIGEIPLQPGDAVLACPDGVLDVLRVEQVDESGVSLAADADPAVTRVPAVAVKARVKIPPVRPPPAPRRRRRRNLELREATRAQPDAQPGDDDPARSVLAKYDAQAEFYSRSSPRFDPALMERLRQAFKAGGRILVIGCGAGHECFALAREGWEVLGIDFSPAMIACAEAARPDGELPVEFRVADVRDVELADGSLDGVLFTYDVYSFLPGRRERIAVLARLKRMLRPGSGLFVSGRRCDSTYRRMILTLQWALRPGRPWGDSHTRWIAMDGTLRRSFVHVFSDGGLDREIRAGGFRPGTRIGGHQELEPA